MSIVVFPASILCSNFETDVKLLNEVNGVLIFKTCPWRLNSAFSMFHFKTTVTLNRKKKNVKMGLMVTDMVQY